MGRLLGGELEGGDEGAVVGAGAGTDFAGAANEVFAVEHLVDGDAEEGVVAAPGGGVAAAAGAVHEFGSEGAKAGGIGGAIEVTNDDDGGGAAVGFFGDSLYGGFVRTGVVVTDRREGVGVDEVEFAILELHAGADVGGAVLAMGVDDRAENGMFGIEEDAEVVAARVFDDVGVAGFQRGEGVEPFAADFLQEEKVGVVFLDEGEHFRVAVIAGEDVEGEDFELGAGCGASVFGEGEVVAGERLQLNEEEDAHDEGALAKFGEEQDDEEDGESHRAGEAKMGEEIECPVPAGQEHGEGQDHGGSDQASKKKSKERDHFRGVRGCFDWQGGCFRPEL